MIETLRESWLYKFWNQSENSQILDDLLFSLGAERYLLTIEYNQTWNSGPGKVLRETCQSHLCQFKSFKSRKILHKNSHGKSFVLRRKKEKSLLLFSLIVAINNRSVSHNHFHSSLGWRGGKVLSLKHYGEGGKRTSQQVLGLVIINKYLSLMIRQKPFDNNL